MSVKQCQQALDRVLIYVQGDGLELTREHCRSALRLVDEAMAQGSGPDLPARCVDLIPRYFQCTELPVPQVNPPMLRGHVRYFPHD